VGESGPAAVPEKAADDSGVRLTVALELLDDPRIRHLVLLL
jgi:hypothetical protein